MKRLWIMLVCALVASHAAAQTTASANNLRLLDGNCTITSATGEIVVRSGCTTIATDGSADLTLAPDDDLILQPDDVLTLSPGSDRTDVDGFIGSSGFASKTTGWRVDDLGNADFRYLFADEMHIELLVAEKEAVLAGSQLITHGHARISQTFTCPAGGGTATLWVEDDPSYGDAEVFVSGDTIKIRALTRTVFGPFSASECIGVVTSYSDGSGGNAGQQSWTFTRNSSTAGGGMSNGTTVAVGQTATDFGTSGNGSGYIESTALDGSNNVNAPWVQTAKWTTAPIGANTTVTCRTGNLRGMTGVTGEFGMFCGDITSSLATTKAVKASSQGVDIYNASLNLYSGGTQTFKVDPALPSLAIGATLPTGFGTGTGFWCGIDSGTFKCRIGNPSGGRFEFDGTTSAFYGDAGGATNINGGAIQTNTIHVGALDATGAADNLVKNGTFETATDPLSGWTGSSSNATLPAQSCCGLTGPGTAYFDPGNGQINYINYRAIQVRQGDTYLVSWDVYTPAATTAGIYMILQQSDSNGQVTLVWNGATGGGRVNPCSLCDVYAWTAGNPGGWTHHEYVYTVPAGIYWVSLLIGNASGSLSSSTYTLAHFDNIEFRKQLGPGNIIAHSITAGQIAAGTITATEIAANTITASQISVSNLSSLSSDLGSITGGSININGGTFEVQSNGATNIDVLDTLFVNGGGASFGSGVNITGGGLGVSGGATIDGLRVGNLSGSGDRAVCVNGSGDLYAAVGATCP